MKKKKKQEPNSANPREDEMYQIDELPQDPLMDTRDLNKTGDMDQTRDFLKAENSPASQIEKKSRRRKKKNFKKKSTKSLSSSTEKVGTPVEPIPD